VPLSNQEPGPPNILAWGYQDCGRTGKHTARCQRLQIASGATVIGGSVGPPRGGYEVKVDRYLPLRGSSEWTVLEVQSLASPLLHGTTRVLSTPAWRNKPKEFTTFYKVALWITQQAQCFDGQNI
jgi:hypothetical protein